MSTEASRQRADPHVRPADAARRPLAVCMYVPSPARTDERVMREATALARAGLDVTIVDVERDGARPRREDFRGVHLRHIVMPSLFKKARFKLWTLVRLSLMMARSALEVSRTPADVYHAHDDIAFFACYLSALLRRKRLILDAHELPLAQPNLAKFRLLSAVAHAIIRLMIRRADGVITVSAPIAREMRRRYGGPVPVLVRNVPIYHEPVQASDELRSHLGLAPDMRVALYQGGFRANRSLDVLVRAARYLRDRTVLVLMGEGDRQPSLEALIAAEGVGGRVLIVPTVPYDALLRWTASADLGLIVYRPEYSLNVRYCLPNKLFEYLMAGVPVLASRLDAVAEILSTYDVGSVVTSLDPQSVGGAINAMLADTDALQRMRQNGLRAAQREFRWDVEQTTLLDLYRHVLQSRLGQTTSQALVAPVARGE